MVISGVSLFNMLQAFVPAAEPNGQSSMPVDDYKKIDVNEFRKLIDRLRFTPAWIARAPLPKMELEEVDDKGQPLDPERRKQLGLDGGEGQKTEVSNQYIKHLNMDEILKAEKIDQKDRPKVLELVRKWEDMPPKKLVELYYKTNDKEIKSEVLIALSHHARKEQTVEVVSVIADAVKSSDLFLHMSGVSVAGWLSGDDYVADLDANLELAAGNTRNPFADKALLALASVYFKAENYYNELNEVFWSMTEDKRLDIQGNALFSLSLKKDIFIPSEYVKTFLSLLESKNDKIRDIAIYVLSKINNGTGYGSLLMELSNSKSGYLNLLGLYKLINYGGAEAEAVTNAREEVIQNVLTRSRTWVLPGDKVAGVNKLIDGTNFDQKPSWVVMQDGELKWGEDIVDIGWAQKFDLDVDAKPEEEEAAISENAELKDVLKSFVSESQDLILNGRLADKVDTRQTGLMIMKDEILSSAASESIVKLMRYPAANVRLAALWLAVHKGIDVNEYKYKDEIVNFLNSSQERELAFASWAIVDLFADSADKEVSKALQKAILRETKGKNNSTSLIFLCTALNSLGMPEADLTQVRDAVTKRLDKEGDEISIVLPTNDDFTVTREWLKEKLGG